MGALAGGTVAGPVGNLIDTLVNPGSGTLSGVTGLLESLTSTNGGPLGVLTELVDGLVNIQNQGLEPLISTLNELLKGLDEAGSGGSIGTVVDLSLIHI